MDEVDLNISLYKLLGYSTDSAVPILSDTARQAFEVLNEVFLCSLIGLFGMAASLINMTVFVKQGLNSTINISLFSLAMSDFGGMATLVWFGICKNPLFEYSGVPMVTREVSYLTGAWPHACFARITCWLTAYITGERCICIALPLKSKQIITPPRTATIICFIFAVTMLLQVPQYAAAYIGWKFYPASNKTLLGLRGRNNRVALEGLSFCLNTANGLFSFTTVIIFTAILIVKLRQQRKWRKTSAIEADSAKSNRNKERDKKTMVMILVISCVLIVCYFPGLVTSFMTFVEPQFSTDGVYSNIFLTAWSFCNMLECVNSSVNIFFYYTMSTRYRQTFTELFLKSKAVRMVKGNISTVS